MSHRIFKRAVSLIIWLVVCGFDVRQATWIKLRVGTFDKQINCILSQTPGPSILFVGTDKGIYRSSDRGKLFEKIIDLTGYSGGVREIFISSRSPENIYAITSDALLFSQDFGLEWKKIYETHDAGEQFVCGAQADGTIYIGTTRGIRYSREGDAGWREFGRELTNKPVFRLRIKDNIVYASTDTEIFEIIPQTGHLEKIFDLSARETDGEISVETQENTSICRIKDFSFDATSEGNIWVASDIGMQFSDDLGDTWKSLPLGGFPAKDVTSIIVPTVGTASHGVFASAGTRASGSAVSGEGGPLLLAGTGKGVFILANSQWEPIYMGMENLGVQILSQNQLGDIFAVTTHDVYALNLMKNKQDEATDEKVNKADLNLDAEPLIGQVQEWAIDYAEVSNEKIQSWRRAANRKAILPTLSFGVNRAATELYHWDTGSNPDALVKGREFLDWDASVSWNLGELIWNPDQTSIDSRSKMMVELREDIISQVTRIYFERKRLLREHAANIPSEEKIDITMRIQELTALLDGFTGGRFSAAAIKDRGGWHANF